MPKVNLDSDIKLILRFLPIPEIELLKQMTNELKAARECVEYLRTVAGHTKGSNRLDGIPYIELECLAKYDEATK